MYGDWADKMAAASGASGRRAVVEDMRRTFGFSPAKAYRLLREAGWESGRARRRDAGTTSVSAEALATLAGMVRGGITKDGKATMPANVARSIMEARGEELAVGDSRLRELLRRGRMSASDASTPSPHRTMRTERPNQVHECDPSVSRLWFPPGGGRMKILGADETYKNKNKLEGREKLWRYVLTDHLSGSLCVRYYAAAGENAANLWDFLIYAWGRKSIGAYVFHGTPELLLWDCGSANISRAVTNALRAFGVETKPHLPGRPRAKGQVEKGNHMVETHFESRLRLEPVSGMDELNGAAERWCAAFNANLIKGLDCRLNRGGVKIGTRAALWRRIAPEQLREIPDAQTCRQVLASGIQTRKVDGALTVGIVHPRAGRSLRYDVRGIPGALVGARIRLQPMLAGEGHRCVAIAEGDDGKDAAFELSPISYDEFGFDESAPVLGREYKAQPDTARETAAKALEGSAGNLAGPAHSFITGESPFVRGATGSVIEIADAAHVHEVLISAAEAAMRHDAAGLPTEGRWDYYSGAYPDGVPARAVDEAIEKEKAAASPRESAAGRYADWIVEGAKTPEKEAKPAAEGAAEKLMKIA